MSMHPKRVFILDDQVSVASTLAMILRTQGIDVTAFSDPLKALQAARSQCPELIVSDISMPVLSGIDLAILLSAEQPDCKVLLISGSTGDPELLEAAMTHGHVFGVLQKPVYPYILLRRINALLNPQLSQLALPEATDPEVAACRVHPSAAHSPTDESLLNRRPADQVFEAAPLQAHGLAASEMHMISPSNPKNDSPGPQRRIVL
jgi:CheY-like chemotaxis protein